MGTVTGGGSFDDGATCTLTATPNADYEFVNWSDGSTANPYTFTVNADVNIVANFKHVEGIKVTFNGASWTGDPTSSYLLTLSGVTGGRASSTATGDSYPLADAFWNKAEAGTFTDNTSDGMNYNNSVVNYVEYYEDAVLQDNQNNKYGDWWAKSVTINVKTFDATSLSLGAEVDATMFDAEGAFVDDLGFDAAPTTSMKMNLYGTMQTAKGLVVLNKDRKLKK
jgi:hypothetical protein